MPCSQSRTAHTMTAVRQLLYANAQKQDQSLAVKGLKSVVIAIVTTFRTWGSKGVWGRCPQPRVPPLHPVLTHLPIAMCLIDSRNSLPLLFINAMRCTSNTAKSR